MATGDRWPVASRYQQVINLGVPECYAYIRDAMLRLLDEYKISYIKWDHNRDLVDAGTAPSGRPGVHEQTLAFYRLVAELKAAYPGPGDRVLLLRRGAGRPGGAGARRPGLGQRLHRPAGAAADATAGPPS